MHIAGPAVKRVKCEASGMLEKAWELERGALKYNGIN